MLTRLFFEFFPKKKNDVPTMNLKWLVDAFDTTEGPTIQLKRLSVKRGAEGTVALSLSHVKQVDWSKLSSSQACDLSEMKKFFSEAKKYSQKLVKLILPVPTPSSAAPSSSAHPTPDSTPSEVSQFVSSILSDNLVY
jgi:hypothetical protein